MNRRMLVAAIAIAAGCGSAQPGPLDVEMLSVTGEISGTEAPTLANATASGEGDGHLATFFVEAPNLSIQLSACTPDDSQLDPYGSGGGPTGPVPQPAIVDQNGDPAPTTVTGVDCIGHSLSICLHRSCTQFDQDAVDLQIVEENGWRRVTADATNASGTVSIALRFHEHH